MYELIFYILLYYNLLYSIKLYNIIIFVYYSYNKVLTAFTFWTYLLLNNLFFILNLELKPATMSLLYIMYIYLYYFNKFSLMINFISIRRRGIAKIQEIPICWAYNVLNCKFLYSTKKIGYIFAYIVYILVRHG